MTCSKQRIKWLKHSFVWRYVVLDDGHKIKSNGTQISSVLRYVTAEYRLILTGTPLQNNLVELWALLAWLYPDVFTENTRALFRESFDLNRGKVKRKTMDDARRLLELIMLRRMKDSPGVDLELPPKEEMLLYVPLTPMQRFRYTRMLTKVDDAMLEDLFVDGRNKEKAALTQDKEDIAMLLWIEKLEPRATSTGDDWEEITDIMRQVLQKEKACDSNSAWRKLMNLVMQLRKCCSHPYLLPGTMPDPYYVGQHIIRASGKFILLEKLLRHQIFQQQKKVLIFSGFTETLDYCEDMLAFISPHGELFKYLRFDGGTARARRNLYIRLFNDPKNDYKVMLVAMRAGGIGINLTSAEDVIFLDEDWNSQITLQAEARAHRIGQRKKVTIYKLYTQGTVEEQMMGRIRKKLYLSAKLTESMRSIHGANAPRGNKGLLSLNDDIPEMSTTQLKTLVRRGAQTLSHPEIDVMEMVSWDLDTMIQKCHDKPADPQSYLESGDLDEEKWLSVMERVECTVFDGKRYQCKPYSHSDGAAANILPDSISRSHRRVGKNTTIMVDGFAISKESLSCGDWEAVPTLAGKDLRLAGSKREKRREFEHEGHCGACFKGPSGPDEEDEEDKADLSLLIECKSCPRTYYLKCLWPEYKSKAEGSIIFVCSQHTCCYCDKNTTDAGGLIYRCRWCPRGFQFEMLGQGPTSGGFYIKCDSCIEAAEEKEELKQWMMGMESSYKDQHTEWVNNQKEQIMLFDKDQVAVQHNKQHSQTSKGIPPLGNVGIRRSGPFVLGEDDSRVPSPPALTDALVVTPAAGGSGASTPRLELQRTVRKKRIEIDPNEDFTETREEKRARLSDKRLTMRSNAVLPDGDDSDA